MHACWVRDPDERPSFEDLKAQLEELWMELRQDDMKRQNQGTAGDQQTRACETP